MKKRGTNKPHKDNIFLFPNVDKLLLERGLESLKNKRFVEAVDYFEKAKELDPYNEELELSLIIAYLESGNLSNAKTLANECLQKGIGDYFQLIDLYIMILLQLNEYQEIIVTLEALLEEKEIPIEKVENFSKILEFSKRKLESDYIKSANKPIEKEILEEISFDLFQYENLNEQFLAVAQLSEKNVRNYLPGIKAYLSSAAGHPFIKTMLLQLLKEQEVSEETKVEKFHQNLVINPVQIAEIGAFADLNGINIILKRELEHENPTLFESIKAIVDRHSFLLFPIELRSNDPKIWAAAYHYLAMEYFGIDSTMEKISEKYELNVRKLTEAIAFLRELEEISSPIL